MASSAWVFGQGVSVSEDGSNPDPSAILDVKSTDKGMLLPRLSNTQRDNIASPATGLYIYNSSTNRMNYFNGDFWIQIPQNDCPYRILSALKKLDVTSGNFLFTIDHAADITDFVWTVPDGWVINSGQGTNSIEVAIDELNTSETVAVSLIKDGVEQCYSQYNFVKSVLLGGTKTVYVADGTNGVLGATYEMSVFNFSGDNDLLEIISPPADGQIEVFVWGAGGGFGGTNAGSGGFTTGKINVSNGQQFLIRTGEAGFRAPTSSSPVPFTAGPYPSAGGTYGTAGTGGGYSGIFDISENPLMIAGGGGGGGFTNAGGSGGGTVGIDGASNGASSTGGTGGTQSAGGVAGTGTTSTGMIVPTDGDAYQGGDGGRYQTDVTYNGGGGGSGYYGGGGGFGYWGSGGGGGSGFVAGSVVAGSTSSNAGTTPPASSNPFYQSGIGVGGTSTANTGGNGIVIVIARLD